MESLFKGGVELVVTKRWERPNSGGYVIGEHIIIEHVLENGRLQCTTYHPNFGPDGFPFTAGVDELLSHAVNCPPEQSFSPYRIVYQCYLWLREREGQQALDDAEVPTPFQSQANLVKTQLGLQDYLEACYNDGDIGDPRPRRGDDKELDDWMERIRMAGRHFKVFGKES